MLEFSKDIDILSGIELFSSLWLKFLDSKEEMQEILCTWYGINVDRKQSLQCLVALGEFAHCSKVNWIPLQFVILSSQDLFIPICDVLGIPF